MVFSMLREAPDDSGKPGPFSFRRCAAAWFSVLSPVLFYLGLGYSENGWTVFIPGASSLIAVLILAFFTTWGDIAAIVQAAKGNK